MASAWLDAVHPGGQVLSMTEKPKERPQVNAAGEQASRRREERLAAALRANLSRRKAQARQRGEEAPAGEGKG